LNAKGKIAVQQRQKFFFSPADQRCLTRDLAAQPRSPKSQSTEAISEVLSRATPASFSYSYFK
jgi:hypothetical protein